MPLATELPPFRIILAYNGLRVSGHGSARWCPSQRTRP